MLRPTLYQKKRNKNDALGKTIALSTAASKNKKTFTSYDVAFLQMRINQELRRNGFKTKFIK